MDRIALFQTFARVVECASFTRAADTLGQPRSSVSAAIQNLESLVGVRLLHRTTRTVALTPDGAAFYERCLRVIADVEETENLFRQSAAGLSGRLRIDVPGRIGRLIIAPALTDFLAQYPHVDVDLGITDRAINLIEDSVDCVLRVGVRGESGLTSRPIGDLPLINVASRTYLREHGTPRTPADLSGHFAVNYASPSSGRIEDWEWLEDGKAHALPMRGRVSVDNAEAYIACCLAGLGLIQIPAYDVRSHLASGELVEVLPEYRAASMPMSLLYPRRQYLPRRVQVFSDWLDALLKREVLS